MGRIAYMDDPADPCRILATDEVWEVRGDGLRKWAVFKSWSEMRAIVRRERTLAHFIGPARAPSMMAWANELEGRYFAPPGSARADLYRYHEGRWGDTTLMIVSIPRRLERFAEKVAEECRLERVPMLDVLQPVVREHRFPISGESVRFMIPKRLLRRIGDEARAVAEGKWDGAEGVRIVEEGPGE